MNIIKYVVFKSLLLLLLTTCASDREVFESQFDTTAQLPPVNADANRTYMELWVMFHVMEDGSIADVTLLDTSSDPRWDAAAIDSMKQWRYLEPVSEEIVMKRKVKVDIMEPVYMNVGEIIAVKKKKADWLYEQLNRNVDFHSLAKSIIENDYSGVDVRYRWNTELSMYPAQARDKLLHLKVNQYTRPVLIGNKYVIYKRFSKFEEKRNLVDNPI